MSLLTWTASERSMPTREVSVRTCASSPGFERRLDGSDGLASLGLGPTRITLAHPTSQHDRLRRY
jgi:hypothetical protein